MGGFGQGLIQGLREGQDRQMEAARLQLEQQSVQARIKAQETDDQLRQLQLASLFKKMQAESALPGMTEEVMGPQAAPLQPGQEGPMPPADIDRRKLFSLLMAAQQAGQDPNQLLGVMSLADPRIKSIADSLQPAKMTKLGEGESLVNERTGQPVAQGRSKAHVLSPGSTLFREGEQPLQAPEKTPEPKPIVASPGQTIIMPDGQQFTIPAAPSKPVAVSPGQQLVNPDTGQSLFQAPMAPEKPVVVPPGASLIQPGQSQPSFTAPQAPPKPMAVSPGQSLVKPDTGEAIFTAPQPPAKPMEVSPGASLVNPETGGTIFTAPAAPPKPPDFGDRLESAAAAYGQAVYGKPTTFTELLSLDPIKANKIRQQAMVDEPAQIAAAKASALLPEKEKELLSPEDANKLGVPFGTTKGEAKGVLPLTVQQREALAAFDSARTIIDDIKQYSENVNKAAGGLRGRAEQSMRLWGAWTQSDPDAALLASKAGELSRLARSMGEKGAMAEGDIARAAALVPSVVDTREVAQQKLKDLTAIIEKGEANFRKSLGMMKPSAPAPSKPAPVTPEAKPDPMSNIPVPPGLTPQQAEVYKKAYAEQQQQLQQKMRPKNAKPKPQ